MNAIVACVADAKATAAAELAGWTGQVPDPLDDDQPSDEVVVTTRCGLVRVALVATEVAARFQR